MGGNALFKLALSFLLLNYSQKVLAQDSWLISKSKWNSPENSNANGQSKREIVNGEKLVVAEGISCWEQNGHWEKLQLCPNSTIVTGHRFRYLVRTGLTGIQLKCTKKHGPDETENPVILDMNFDHQVENDLPRGKWGIWKNKSASVFAEGFSFNRGELTLGRTVQNYNIIYHSGSQTKLPKKSTGNSNSDKMYTKCPRDHAICGLTAMMDKAQLGILTAIGLKCCHHCVPKETWVTIHHYDNPSDSKVEQTVSTTVGLERSLQNLADDVEISQSVLHKGFSARFQRFRGNSNSTGFDWSGASFSLWTEKTPGTETYSCGPKSSCVLKQLVGHCGSARIPVDHFCHVSVLFGNPDSCSAIAGLQPIVNRKDAMTIPSVSPPCSNKRTIYPHGNGTSLEVLCDFETDGGGWTIIQKRSSGPQQEFNRTWNEYKNGFGSLHGNFWIGLENIRALTKNWDQELRIELEDFEGEKKWAQYSWFLVSDSSDFYRLKISGFYRNSTLQDSLTWGHNGQRFTTIDKDNDKDSSRNCAVICGGGGWFTDCAWSNLNGLYFEKEETVSDGQGIWWLSWKGADYSMAKTEMKIRTKKS